MTSWYAFIVTWNLYDSFIFNITKENHLLITSIKHKSNIQQKIILPCYKNDEFVLVYNKPIRVASNEMNGAKDWVDKIALVGLLYLESMYKRKR